MHELRIVVVLDEVVSVASERIGRKTVRVGAGPGILMCVENARIAEKVAFKDIC